MTGRERSVISPRRGGFTVMEAMLLVLVGLVVATIVLAESVQRRRRTQEAGAIRSLKTIGTAEAIFRECDKDGNGILDYGTLAALGRADLVDAQLAAGSKDLHRFEAGPGRADPTRVFWVVANPDGLWPDGVARPRAWCTNQAGLLFYTTAADLVMDDGVCAIPSGLLHYGR